MKNTFLYVLVLFAFVFTLAGCNGENDKEKEPEEIDTTLYTTYTDETIMDFTYEGKNFVTDGAGVVTLSRCTDGDTAQFSNGTMTFAVRFLGIDTPESTYRIDPWGKSASAYTCDKLENATEIVLESDGARMDGNGRYLAWVWYDGRLLNLELIEQAFSNARGTTDTKYEDVVYDAELKTQPENLYPNLTTEANIVIQTKTNALLIPRNYMLNDSQVVIQNKDVITIQTGLKDYDKVEVLSGLKKGDVILKPIK